MEFEPKNTNPKRKRGERPTGPSLALRVGMFLPLAFSLLSIGIVYSPAVGQIPNFIVDRPVSTPGGNRYELSETLALDEAEGPVLTYLERVKQYLADDQWDEAVETLRQVMEESGDKLLGVTPRRFISVRDYCHLQLASLPPEALSLYRGRVDPVSQRWYEEGKSNRDRRLLTNVVNQAFASSWGDNALAALGEMALEEADYAAARSYWEKIIPVDHPPDTPHTWLCVPDTDLDVASILARLILVSIMEGSSDRARDELAALRRSHAEAAGWFGGREVNYVEALESLLAESDSWPGLSDDGRWPTFAGSPQRQKTAAHQIDPRQVAWRIPLRQTLPAAQSVWGSGSPTPRVAEDAASPLSYHPVVAGNLVLVNNQVEILAAELTSGSPPWRHDARQVYRDQFDEAVHALYNPPDNLGVPRFTATEFGGKLYARMGSAVTARPQHAQSAGGSGYLVAIDLEAQGRLVWKTAPDDASWAFEGSPLADGSNVYVAMRRSDIQPQAHVACFDAETGRLRWRTFVCAAETPARAMLHETTHNLLSIDRRTIYYNTNLGAVAALSADDGRIKWVSLYPRVRQGDLLKPGAYTCRDLNPCLVDRGTLLVAPADSPMIFALDAAAGQILWHTGHETEDVVHLLGTADDNLIASGEKLYWISLKLEDAGRVKHVWPVGHEKPGYGRGILAGGNVWWPTRRSIYVFDQATGRLKKEVSLATRGISGGNLLMAGDHLLIATDEELVALSQTPPQQSPAGATADSTRREPPSGRRSAIHASPEGTEFLIAPQDGQARRLSYETLHRQPVN